MKSNFIISRNEVIEDVSTRWLNFSSGSVRDLEMNLFTRRSDSDAIRSKFFLTNS